MKVDQDVDEAPTKEDKGIGSPSTSKPDGDGNTTEYATDDDDDLDDNEP